MFNPNPVRDNNALRATAFAVFPVAMTQMLEEFSAAQFIALHETVIPFMADAVPYSFTYTSNLLRTPFLAQAELDERDSQR